MAGFADKRNITLLNSVFSQSEKIGREYLDGVDIDRLLSPMPKAETKSSSKKFYTLSHSLKACKATQNRDI